jgi:hypothetical protein
LRRDHLVATNDQIEHDTLPSNFVTIFAWRRARRKAQAASRKPQAASRKPQAASRLTFAA